MEELENSLKVLFVLSGVVTMDKELEHCSVLNGEDTP